MCFLIVANLSLDVIVKVVSRLALAPRVYMQFVNRIWLLLGIVVEMELRE